MLENAEDWEFILPQVLLAYRSTINAQGYAPCTLLFGERLTLPVDLCCANAPPITDEPEVELVKRIQRGLGRARLALASQTPTHATAMASPKYAIGNWVYSRIFPEKKGFNARYSGPYLLEKVQGVTATIRRNGISQVVNMDNLKLATGPRHQNTQSLPAPVPYETINSSSPPLSSSTLPSSTRRGRIVTLPARYRQ